MTENRKIGKEGTQSDSGIASTISSNKLTIPLSLAFPFSCFLSSLNMFLHFFFSQGLEPVPHWILSLCTVNVYHLNLYHTVSCVVSISIIWTCTTLDPVYCQYLSFEPVPHWILCSVNVYHLNLYHTGSCVLSISIIWTCTTLDPV